MGAEVAGLRGVSEEEQTVEVAEGGRGRGGRGKAESGGGERAGKGTDGGGEAEGARGADERMEAVGPAQRPAGKHCLFGGPGHGRGLNTGCSPRVCR